jgi:hypothetical protein
MPIFLNFLLCGSATATQPGFPPWQAVLLGAASKYPIAFFGPSGENFAELDHAAQSSPLRNEMQE